MLRGIQWKGTDKLFAGRYTDEDAMVVKMPDGSLAAFTVDVFTPVVDDPYTYGQVAAANSLSDIYAMGGTPRFALAIMGYPPDIFSPATASAVLQGAIDKCHEVEVVLGGGHTLRSSEILFGLALTGDFPDGKVLLKSAAQPSDVLVLTKPLGIGILTTALKQQLLSPEEIAVVERQMTALNDRASRIALECGVSACTDVTGFGLLGHLLEMCKASHLRARLRFSAVPILKRAIELASQGVAPAGTKSNLEFVSPDVFFDPALSWAEQLVLADAQTSGGLLLCVPLGDLRRFRELCAAQGQFCAIIGEMVSGTPAIEVFP